MQGVNINQLTNIFINYEKYLSQGDKKRRELSEFNSNNTKLLNVEEIKKKLLTCELVVEELNAWNNHRKGLVK